MSNLRQSTAIIEGKGAPIREPHPLSLMNGEDSISAVETHRRAAAERDCTSRLKKSRCYLSMLGGCQTQRALATGRWALVSDRLGALYRAVSSKAVSRSSLQPIMRSPYSDGPEA